MAEQMLCNLGVDRTIAKQHIDDFSNYDAAFLQRQQSIYTNPQKIVESNLDMLHELKNLFENDQFIQQQTEDDTDSNDADSKPTSTLNTTSTQATSSSMEGSDKNPPKPPDTFS
ncbi:hypothetical protein GWI33_010022 [Rhynchophorus ferrugineus]|uniref:Uncharacterized protein n=1 Tax=Rhynchophorus ferrugineus TaxID=354439 RepID=A0A834ICH5_RHYFE|nr:hypothetical protein GWI33_010022 [Rhynchophorus ferrugineus]